jgi:glc operon protein GlcG
MRTGVLTGVTLAAGLLLGAAAHAQQPAAPESGRSPPPDYGEPINIDQAKSVAASAIAEAKKNSWRMAVTIVGPQGELIYFEKMDGTQSSSATLAEAKARTSALFRRPSKLFADQFAAGNAAFMTFPDNARPIASEGGIPIIVDGKLIGAIGVSGGTAQQDTIAANSGANALK